MARHWVSLYLVRRVAWPVRPQAEWVGSVLLLPAAGRSAEPELRPVGLRRAAQPAAQQAVSSFAAVRARAPARVPVAGRQLAAETAAWEVSPNAEEAEEAAQPDAEQPVGAARSGVEAAAGVRPDVAAGVVAQPGAVAEEAAEPVAAVARAAQDVPPGEMPSGVAWAFRQDPVLPSVPPQPAPTARAMGWSWSVAWPSTRSWQAALFSGVSCALGPAENLKRDRENP
jgi:hypothetical protein